MAKQSTHTPVALDESPAPETWLSLKQAAQYSGRSIQTIKNAIEKRKLIFDASNMRSKEYHPDYPPITEITKSALDAYLEATTKSKSVGGRAARAEGRRYVQLIPDERHDEFVALVTAAGFQAPSIAYKSRAKSAKAESTPTESAPLNGAPELAETPTESFETQLVEA